MKSRKYFPEHMGSGMGICVCGGSGVCVCVRVCVSVCACVRGAFIHVWYMYVYPDKSVNVMEVSLAPL